MIRNSHLARRPHARIGTALAALAAFASAALLASCAMQASPTQATAPGAEPSSGPATKPAPWYLGADISSLASGRGGPGNYRDLDNTPGTEISVMHAHGWNAFRLRVFLSPVAGRGTPQNTLDNTIPLAKQIKAAGCSFMLDIHYSDTWADPQHQNIPAAWQGQTVDQIEKNVEAYTKDVLTQLKAAGAEPDMVQVGNEITGGTLWPLGHVQVPHSDVKNDAGPIAALPQPYDDKTQWSNFTRFIKAGTRAVRATAPSAKIIIHIDCGGDWPITKWFFDHFTDASVDYDIIGQSYYPRYHGTLEGLQQNIANCQAAYHKPTIVAETGYPQAGALTPPYMVWPATQQGQLQFMADLVNTAQRAHAQGVFYWAPEGARGNGMWTATGTPAPSILVSDHLKDLTTRSASKMPEAPATAK